MTCCKGDVYNFNGVCIFFPRRVMIIIIAIRDRGKI